MRQLSPIAAVALVLCACGGGAPAQSPEAGSSPETTTSEAAATDEVTEDATSTEPASPSAAGDRPRDAHGQTPSKIKATATEAAMKYIVVDKKNGPIEGIVIALTSKDGKKYYTEPTDVTGYAEVLVPVGNSYDIVFLSLGRKEITATEEVSNQPRQNIRTTLRYERIDTDSKWSKAGEPTFVLSGITFDTGKAKIKEESFERLDSVVEYMSRKKSVKIEISGHTDNVGDPKANKALSEKRAQACRDYLVKKGIDETRISAVGYGDERPISPNDTAEGRQANRRIEATELK